MKEYFDKHFGPKETFPTGAIQKNKSRLPQRAHGTQKKDSKLPTKDGLRKPTSQIDTQKTGYGNQATKTMIGKAKSLKENSGKTSATDLKRTVGDTSVHTKSTSKGASKIVSKASKSAGTKLKTDSDDELAPVSKLAISGSKIGKSSSKRQIPSRTEAENSRFANLDKKTVTNDSEKVTEESNDDSANELEETEIGGASPYIEKVSRKRSNLASSSSFKPHFGTTQVIQTSHSDDSFFGSERQGHRNVVTTVPTMDVKFVVPHEFYEKF